MSATTTSPVSTPTIEIWTYCMNMPVECNLQLRVLPVVTACAIFLLYGVYVVLFGTCISILVNRKKHRYRLHCLLITTLFLLATASFILVTSNNFLIQKGNDTTYHETVWTAYNGYSEHGVNTTPPAVAFGSTQIMTPSTKLAEPDASSYPKDFNLSLRLSDAAQVIMVTANLTTDLILLWRCYIIWENRYLVVALPALLCLINNIIGYLTIVNFQIIGDVFNSKLPSQYDVLPAFQKTHRLQPQSILIICFSLGTMCTNTIFTSLIAGRVFYISHQVAKYTQQPVRKLYRTVISASLESGLMYPLTLVVYATIMLVAHGSAFKTYCPTDGVCFVGMGGRVTVLNLCAHVLYSCLVLVMGIASTLIIVRSALGIAIKDEQSFRATVLQESETAAAPGWISSVIDIRRRRDSVGGTEDEAEEGRAVTAAEKAEARV